MADRADLFDIQNWNVVESWEWLDAQSGQGRGFCVIHPRTEAGPNSFELAPGAGRNGRDAIRMVLTDDESMPDWWLMKLDRNSATPGVQATNPVWSDGYSVPRGKRANRLHLWMKFPAGFREDLSAIANIQENLHIGTYCFVPGRIDGTGPVVEWSQIGMHLYHHLLIRHDLAQDGWVHICINQSAHHIRGGTHSTSLPATNFMLPYGGYMETLTRWYFSPYPYSSYGNPGNLGGTPEVPPPYEVLIDSVYTEWVDEFHSVKIEIENWKQGQCVDFTSGATSPRYDVVMTNTTNASVSGPVRVRNSLGYEMAAHLYLPGTSTDVDNTTLTFSANEVKNFELELTPPDSRIRNDYAIEFLIEVVNATGGTYTVTLTNTAGGGPQTTDPIPYNATPAELRAELIATTGLDWKIAGAVGCYECYGTAYYYLSFSSSVTGPGAQARFRFSQIPISIDFYDSAQEVNGRFNGYQIKSKADPNVTQPSNKKGNIGPPDGDVCSAHFVAYFWDTAPTGAYIPHTDDGGDSSRCSKNGSFSKQLSSSDREGRAVTFELVDYNAAQDGSMIWDLNPGGLTLSTSGLVEYTPPANWQGVVQFRFRLNNGVRRSRDFTHFIWVTAARKVPASVANKCFVGPGGGLITTS